MYTDYLAQSQVLLEAGLLQEALTPLNVGIALYPQEPELWFAKYKILKALGSPEAWHALTECRRWGPDFLPALTAAYEELLQQRRLREAYQLLETILQKSPDNPAGGYIRLSGHFILGIMLRLRKPCKKPASSLISRPKCSFTGPSS
jgi:tetratricopeptide (TPR) repeat protein